MNIEIIPKEHVKAFDDYDDANLYISLLNIEGKNDWEMVTINQLAGLIDYLQENDYPTKYPIATHADYWYRDRFVRKYMDIKDELFFALGIRYDNK
jgi:hypothetical protein